MSNLFGNFFDNMSNSFQKGAIGRAFSPRNTDTAVRDFSRATQRQDRERPTPYTPPPPDRSFRGGKDAEIGRRFDRNLEQARLDDQKFLEDLIADLNPEQTQAPNFGAIPTAFGAQPDLGQPNFDQGSFNFLDPGFQDIFTKSTQAQLLSSFAPLLSRNDAIPLLADFGLNLSPDPVFNSSLLNRLGANQRLF